MRQERSKRKFSVRPTLVIGLWFLLQFIPGLVAIHSIGGVAYFAHVGGFAAGVVLALLLRSRRPQALPPPPGYPTYSP